MDVKKPHIRNGLRGEEVEGVEIDIAARGLEVVRVPQGGPDKLDVTPELSVSEAPVDMVVPGPILTVDVLLQRLGYHLVCKSFLQKRRRPLLFQNTMSWLLCRPAMVLFAV